VYKRQHVVQSAYDRNLLELVPIARKLIYEP
jgi:hypothetical protein